MGETYLIKMMMKMTFVKKLNICLEYEEIKKLMSVKVKKEYVSVIHQVIKQEEVVNYGVNYYEVNYQYEKIKKVDYIKSRP